MGTNTTTVEIATEPLRTIVKRPFNAEYVRSQLEMGIPVVVEPISNRESNDILMAYELSNKAFVGHYHLWDAEELSHTIVTLPPLPRKPKPKHIIKYHLAGLTLIGKSKSEAIGNVYANTIDSDDGMWMETEDEAELYLSGLFELTGEALLADGTRCEIALQEDV